MWISLYHPDNLIPSLCSHAGGRDGAAGVGGLDWCECVFICSWNWSRATGKYLCTSGDMGWLTQIELMGWALIVMEGNLCLCFWLKQSKKRKENQRERENCLQRKLRECSPLDCGVFEHNALPHNCFQETEQPSESDVYFTPKYCIWGSRYAHKSV